MSAAPEPSRKRKAAAATRAATRLAADSTQEGPSAASILEAFGFNLAALQSTQRYEIFDEIGRGGVARVFIGYDHALQRQVAIKTLRKRLNRDRQAVGLFLNEAKITAKLLHPGIVPIHDIGVLGSGEIYFAMEKVEGYTLRQVLDELAAGTRTQDFVLRIFEQVCHIVAYAHTQGVVHRDLKPDNIMIGGFRDVFVMDWGIARDLTTPVNEAPILSVGEEPEEDMGETKKSRAVKGTPRYMSPEQTLGIDAQVDHRSDVFSLGLILYEILAHEHPFARDSIRDTLHAIRNDTAPPITNRHVGGDLKSICRMALKKVPQERYPNAMKLAEDVSAALSHHPVAAHETTLMERAVKFIRRHQTAAALALCAVIVVAFFLNTRLVKARQAQDLLYQARAAITESQALGSQRDALIVRLPDAAPSQRGALQSQADLLDARAHQELAGAHALLQAAWERHAPTCPPWSIDWLKRLYLDRIDEDLRLGDRPQAQRHLDQLQALINDAPTEIPWSADERHLFKSLKVRLQSPSLADQ